MINQLNYVLLTESICDPVHCDTFYEIDFKTLQNICSKNLFKKKLINTFYPS